MAGFYPSCFAKCIAKKMDLAFYNAFGTETPNYKLECFLQALR